MSELGDWDDYYDPARDREFQLAQLEASSMLAQVCFRPRPLQPRADEKKDHTEVINEPPYLLYGVICVTIAVVLAILLKRKR